MAAAAAKLGPEVSNKEGAEEEEKAGQLAREAKRNPDRGAEDESLAQTQPAINPRKVVKQVKSFIWSSRTSTYEDANTIQ